MCLYLPWIKYHALKKSGIAELDVEFSFRFFFCGANVLYCGKVPAANAPRMHCSLRLIVQTLALVIPTYTARCLHQRP